MARATVRAHPTDCVIFNERREDCRIIQCFIGNKSAQEIKYELTSSFPEYFDFNEAIGFVDPYKIRRIQVILQPCEKLSFYIEPFIRFVAFPIMNPEMRSKHWSDVDPEIVKKTDIQWYIL